MQDWQYTRTNAQATKQTQKKLQAIETKSKNPSQTTQTKQNTQAKQKQKPELQLFINDKLNAIKLNNIKNQNKIDAQNKNHKNKTHI